MKKILAIIITLLTFTGCETIPPVPLAIAPDNGKIGVLVTVADKPSYSYMGSSIFSKEQYILEESWGVEGFVNDYLSKQFESKSQYSIQNLVADEYIKKITNVIYYPKEKPDDKKKKTKNKEDVEDKDKISWDEFITAYRADVSEKNNIDILIHVESTPGQALYNLPYIIDGYGLFTRCYFGFCSAHVVNHVLVTIFDGKTQEIIARGPYEYKKKSFTVDFPDGAKVLPKSGSATGRDIYIEQLEAQIIKALTEGNFL